MLRGLRAVVGVVMLAGCAFSPDQGPGDEGRILDAPQGGRGEGGSSELGDATAAGGRTIEQATAGAAPLAMAGATSRAGAGGRASSGESGSSAGGGGQAGAATATAGAPSIAGGSAGAQGGEAGRGGAPNGGVAGIVWVPSAGAGGAMAGGGAAGSAGGGAGAGGSAPCVCSEGECCDGCQFRASSYFLGQFVTATRCMTDPNWIEADNRNKFCAGASATDVRWTAVLSQLDSQCPDLKICAVVGLGSMAAQCIDKP